MREKPIAIATLSDKLPKNVYNACLKNVDKDNELLKQLKLLTPFFNNDSDNEMTLKHIEEVCNVNATQRTNVDDIALKSYDAISGFQGGQRSLKGSSLPCHRSLLNHSCSANTSTLHLKGG